MSRNATPFERFAAFNFGILAIPSSIHAAHSVEFNEFFFHSSSYVQLGAKTTDFYNIRGSNFPKFKIRASRIVKITIVDIIFT